MAREPDLTTTFDHDLWASDAETSPQTVTARPEARLVVVRSRRGWSAALLPPLLILLAAFTILRLPDSALSIHDEKPFRASSSTSASAEGEPTPRFPVASPFPEPEPLIAHLVEIPELVPIDPDPLPLSPQPSIDDAPRADAIGFVRREPSETGEDREEPSANRSHWEAPLAAAARAPLKPPLSNIEEEREPEPTVEDEARRIAEERANLVQIKDDLLEEQRRETARRAQEVAARERRRIEDERVPFREELRKILRQGDSEAGVRIGSLCLSSGSRLSGELAARSERLFRSASFVRLDTRARVEAFRKLGWPEPLILRELAEEERESVGSRRGPRNDAQLYVNAARKLLAVPLTPKSPSRPATPPVVSRRMPLTP